MAFGDCGMMCGSILDHMYRLFAGVTAMRCHVSVMGARQVGCRFRYQRVAGHVRCREIVLQEAEERLQKRELLVVQREQQLQQCELHLQQRTSVMTGLIEEIKRECHQVYGLKADVEGAIQRARAQFGHLLPLLAGQAAQVPVSVPEVCSPLQQTLPPGSEQYQHLGASGSHCEPLHANTAHLHPAQTPVTEQRHVCNPAASMPPGVVMPCSSSQHPAPGPDVNSVGNCAHAQSNQGLKRHREEDSGPPGGCDTLAQRSSVGEDAVGAAKKHHLASQPEQAAEQGCGTSHSFGPASDATQKPFGSQPPCPVPQAHWRTVHPAQEHPAQLGDLAHAAQAAQACREVSAAEAAPASGAGADAYQVRWA